MVKEGVIDYLVGQKRELFTRLGGWFLFDMGHKTMQISGKDALTGCGAFSYNNYHWFDRNR
ncbi:MAG TPA: hypothetical protein VK645_13335 [Chitinophagaceae bacterium]|nr:hypothetical protein [Chitinophagaceae bacterium]